MDIKVYANKDTREGLEANGYTLEDVKKELRKKVKELAFGATDVTTAVNTDVDLEEVLDRLEAIELKIAEWEQG